LKPGGAHIFTVPWYSWAETRIRAKLQDGKIVHLEEPVYHGNPIDPKGSLVITEWGEDLCNTIYESCGMPTMAIRIRDVHLGIDGMFPEVFISRKLSQTSTILTHRW
jgi:hypothetical protein